MHFHMTYTYPENPSEKIKGTFVDVRGSTITFEIPGVFNQDGSCDQPACDAAVTKFVTLLNKNPHGEKPNVARGIEFRPSGLAVP